MPMVLNHEDCFKGTSNRDSTALTMQAKPKASKGKKPSIKVSSSTLSKSSLNKNLECTCHKCGEKIQICKDCPKQSKPKKEQSNDDLIMVAPSRTSTFVHILVVDDSSD